MYYSSGKVLPRGKYFEFMQNKDFCECGWAKALVDANVSYEILITKTFAKSTLPNPRNTRSTK